MSMGLTIRVALLALSGCLLWCCVSAGPGQGAGKKGNEPPSSVTKENYAKIKAGKGKWTKAEVNCGGSPSKSRTAR
jgi:hypothetical protein